MNRYPFLYFTLLQIYRNKHKHKSIFIISTILVMLLSSFLFIANSIQNDIKLTINNQADLIVQKIEAGRVVDIPNDLADEFIEIEGVSVSIPRVYGKYFYEPAEHYFTIVGVDFFDKQAIKNLQLLIKDIDIDEFLNKPNMIIGDGVKKFLDYYEYKKYYNFRPPDRSIKKVYIYKTFPKDSNIVSSDMIIVDINLARTILGIDDDKSTDILINIKNKLEINTIIDKIRANHFDTRVIKKDDLLKIYKNFFDYKSTIFLLLYIIVLVTFSLILYQRYTLINSSDKKNIAILRTLGWNINSIINLKLLENSIIFTISFIIGINLGYIYVFILNAPLLKNIFLGFSNLPVEVTFTPTVDISIFIMIFLFFIVPILASIIIPTWKISITDPKEAIK